MTIDANADELNILLQTTLLLAQRAGQDILKYYRQETQQISTKANDTPLTAADLSAHQIITEGLSQCHIQFPILSEEGSIPSFTERQKWSTYWLVDPLDGTREFIAHHDDFSVNIALIHNHQPILGVIYVPVLDQCYFALADKGAWRQVANQTPTLIHTRKMGSEWVFAVSRSHGKSKLAQRLPLGQPITLIEMGSSYKCCYVAEGNADCYPRFSTTMEWDTAAGHCILRAAGGEIFDLQGAPLQYNCKENLENPHFIAVADPDFDWISLFNP